MISKRDNLLMRPWMERRYENHRRKVESAVPAIDSKPPSANPHVSTKLKKRQKEKERCVEIERDNLILLQKLEAIMRKNRLDNKFSTPPPSFLNRVAMYGLSRKPSTTSGITDAFDQGSKCSKHKCSACFPDEKNCGLLSERLLPWEEKNSASKSRTSKSAGTKPSTTKTIRLEGSKTRTDFSVVKSKRKMSVDVEHASCVTLSRGNLNLTLTFPKDTEIVYHDGNVTKVIRKSVCMCNGNAFNAGV